MVLRRCERLDLPPGLAVHAERLVGSVDRVSLLDCYVTIWGIGTPYTSVSRMSRPLNLYVSLV
jgi:hypothetical protein